MKYIRNINEKFAFYQVEEQDIFNSVEFSILVNYYNYSLDIETVEFEYDIIANYRKELDLFEKSYYYAVLCEKDIVGTIRTVKWDKGMTLPMEEIYGLSIDNIVGFCHKEVWHIGRFAIDRKARYALSNRMLKMLLMYAIAPVCQRQASIVLAECDIRLLKIINKLGIKTMTLAFPVDYLGSETVPILSNKNDLMPFYIQNENLLII